MSYTILNAYIYLDNENNYDTAYLSSDENKPSLKREYIVDITKEVQKFWLTQDDNTPLKIQATNSNFSSDISFVTEPKIKELVNTVKTDQECRKQFGDTFYVKMYISLISDDRKTQQCFVVVRNSGWGQVDCKSVALVQSPALKEAILYLHKKTGGFTKDTLDQALDYIKQSTGVDLKKATETAEQAAKTVGGAVEKAAEKATELADKASTAVGKAVDVIGPYVAQAAKLAQGAVERFAVLSGHHIIYPESYGMRITGKTREEYKDVRDPTDKTENFTKCVIRFAGGLPQIEYLNKKYPLNPAAPGYEVWKTARGEQGPIIGRKPDEVYDENIEGVVVVLKDAINDYNTKKLDLKSDLEKEMFLITRQLTVMDFFLDSPACLDPKALTPIVKIRRKPKTQQEVKNHIVKDFEFLSNKNKKIHSTLMEQLKKDLKRG